MAAGSHTMCIEVSSAPPVVEARTPVKGRQPVYGTAHTARENCVIESQNVERGDEIAVGKGVTGIQIESSGRGCLDKNLEAA